MSQNVITIGIVAKYYEGFLNGNIMAGIHEGLEQINARIIAVRTANVDNPDYELYNYPIASEVADAWIVLNEAVSDAFYRRILDLNKPVISINRDVAGVPSILTDNYFGMYKAVDHLIQHGHRHIACIGPLTSGNMKQRVQGYKDALAAWDIPLNEKLLIDSKSFHANDGYDAAELLLGHGVTFTAAAALTDSVALGFIERMHQAGLRVPDDVAVTGYNNNTSAIRHNLATLSHPAKAMGKKAVEWISSYIKGEKNGPMQVVLSGEFIPRGSCGCAPMDIHGGALKEKDSELEDIHLYVDNYLNIASKMMRTHTLDISGLSQMHGQLTGTLASWRRDENNELVLHVENHFSKDASIPDISGLTYRSEAFPPVDVLLDKSGQAQSVYVSLIRTNYSEWGVFAHSGPTSEHNSYQSLGINLVAHLYDAFAHLGEIDQLMLEMRRERERSEQYAMLLHSITDASSDGIWVWDLKTDQIEWYNDRIHRALGYGSKPFLKLSEFAAIIHKDDLIQVKDAVDQCPALPVGSSVHSQFRVLRQDGHYLWTEIRAKILTNDEYSLKVAGSIRDITETKNAEEQITHLAYHDDLTGLYNRRAFHEKLTQTLALIHLQHQPLALFMLDIDRFKLVNDTSGHQLGDQLLVQAAERLIQCFSAPATIFRIGGDEFMVMLPGVDKTEAASGGDRIVHAMRTPFLLGGNEFHVSCSVGISMCPDDGADSTSLIKNADIALYRAKENGRNQWEFFNASMDDETKTIVSIESGLRKALKHQHFVIHYQPQLSTKTGELFGFEVLLRWQHPERGFISPMEFIKTAEDTGLILPIGHWVLTEACRQMKIWQDAGVPAMKCSVNISGKQFEQLDFAAELKSVITESGLDPSLLCLEITETFAINNLDFCLAQLNELTAIGVSIAIDDFGTGYSSLAMLRKLPIQYVKIDRSFIQNIFADEGDAALVRGMISLIQSLNLETIAEGVEDEYQLNELLVNGCHYYQGYLISKPIPAKEFASKFLGIEQ